MNRTTFNGSLLAATAMMCCCFLIGESRAQESPRTWTSADRTETLHATLVEYAEDSSSVVLRTGTGQTLAIPLKKLSNVDRRYVRNYRKQRLRQSPAVSIPANARPTRVSGNVVNEADSLFGIQWAPSVETALATARGKETRDDDRPVMLFRVLGDLRGLM